MHGGFPFNLFSRDEEPDEEVDNSSYYDLLGVNKKASCADVKKKFKVLAKKLHPDKGGDPRRFTEISEAAEVLSDPEKRKIYDRYGKRGIKHGISTEPQDIFDLLEGRGGHKPSRNYKTPNTTQTLSVSLLEIYHGVTKKLSITRNRNCSDCKGAGGSKVKTCLECKGKGHVTKLLQLGPGMYTQSSGPCDSCNGMGKSIESKYKCKKCKGSRVMPEKKSIKVQVDKGCPNHYKYVFYGESDEQPECEPGDLIVKIIEEEHPIFKRKHADLIMTVKISLKEALTGWMLKIQHLDGVKIVAGSRGDIVKPDDMRTVPELGMPLMKTPFKFGNLFIHFDVEFPLIGSLNDGLISKLAKILPGEGEIEKTENAVKTIMYDKSQITENETAIHSDYKEDDEEDPRLMGGHKVQCSGVIF